MRDEHLNLFNLFSPKLFCCFVELSSKPQNIFVIPSKVFVLHRRIAPFQFGLQVAQVGRIAPFQFGLQVAQVGRIAPFQFGLQVAQVGRIAPFQFGLQVAQVGLRVDQVGRVAPVQFGRVGFAVPVDSVGRSARMMILGWRALGQLRQSSPLQIISIFSS